MTSSSSINANIRIPAKDGIFDRFEDGGYQAVLILPFSFTATYITIITTVPHHLLTLIWNVGSHGSEPFEGIKDFFLFAVLRPIDNL